MASGDNPLPQMMLDVNGLPVGPPAQQIPPWQQPAQNPTGQLSNAPIAPPTSAPGVVGGLPPGSLGNLPPASTVNPPDPASNTASSLAPTPIAAAPSPGVIAMPQPYQFGSAGRGGAVKNVLTRAFYGMGQAMLAHVGLPTDYDIQKTTYQQALQANDLALKQAEQVRLQQAQAFQQQTVDTPLGPMPKQTWEKIGPAVYSGLFGLQKVALQTRFREVRPGGELVDTETGQTLAGTRNGALVDAALVARYPQLAPLLGSTITAGNVLTASQQALSAAPTKTTTSDTLGTTTVSTKEKLLGNPPAVSGPTVPTAGAGSVITPSAAPPIAGTPSGTFTLPAATAQQNKQTLADMIGTYRLNPTVMGRLIAKHPDMLSMVQAQYPNWDQTLYNAKNKLVTDFFAGPEGNQINASNTALGHLGVLNSAIDALNNGDLKVLNGLANSLRLQTGNSAPTVFQTIVHRVAPELAKAYVASGGTGQERGADEKDFDPSLGPTQLRANAAISAQLLRSQLNSLENKWNLLPGRLGTEIPFSRFMTPDAQRVLNQLAPQAATPQAAAPVSRAQPGEVEIHDRKTGALLGYSRDNGKTFSRGPD